MTEALEAHDDFVRPTIPFRYVAEMLAAASDVDARLLTHAGVPEDAYEKEGYRVSGAQFEALHHGLVTLTDDEVYGMLRRPVPRGTYGTLVRQAVGYRDMRATLNGAMDLYGLFDGHAPWTLSVKSEMATLRLQPRDATQRGSLLLAHMMLLTTWRTLGWLAAETLELSSVCLSRRFARYVPETRFLFDAETTLCRGPSALRFEAAVLDLPVRRTREAAARWIAGASFAEMLGRPPRGSLETRVRTALAQTMPVGGAKLPEVARRLGLSQQTLSRRLRERDLSFRQIKDSVRRDHSVSRLSKGATVAEVADSLGYSEPSAFQRAFKTWTGVPPGQWRATSRAV